MEVSVIIVNYNTCQMTSECIDSIYEQTKDVSFEIILIDNASTDGSKTHFEKDERIRYVYSYENMGFGRANNVGMMLARGEYLFLLNSDTLLVNNAIKLFYEYAKGHDEKAFYGCWLEDKEGRSTLSAENMITVGGLLKKVFGFYWKGIRRQEYSFNHLEDGCKKVGYVTGADMFFHRGIYELTGGFDHVFFMYYEEVDWQLRASKLGVASYLINGPRIIHLCGASQIKQSVFNPNKFRIMFKSEYYYVKKNYNRFQYLVFRLLNPILYIPIFLFARSASIKTALPCIKAVIVGR